MSLPVFFPIPQVVRDGSAWRTVSVRQLCVLADTPCRASGAWCERQVAVSSGDVPAIEVCPGAVGAVRIVVPAKISSERDQARWALGALAYALFDGVARASVAGLAWSRPTQPVGRPSTGRAKSNAERQRAWRDKHSAERAVIASRV